MARGRTCARYWTRLPCGRTRSPRRHPACLLAFHQPPSGEYHVEVDDIPHPVQELPDRVLGPRKRPGARRVGLATPLLTPPACIPACVRRWRPARWYSAAACRGCVVRAGPRRVGLHRPGALPCTSCGLGAHQLHQQGAGGRAGALGSGLETAAASRRNNVVYRLLLSAASISARAVSRSATSTSIRVSTAARLRYRSWLPGHGDVR